jgi:hypothetical protein
MTLVPIDPSNALAVSDYLTRARDWLATAVEKTGPVEIAAAKAEIATAAEATKQLGLSKEIQDDAKEMVRRAEYALGKAIRKAQDEGAIRRQDDGISNQRVTQGESLSRVTDFGTYGELYGRDGKSGVLTLADEMPDSDDFEDALTEARAEGNLSRANVVRKAAEKSGKPRAVSRRPLPDFARDAGIDLRKAVERLERISADDRFGQNREQVASHLRGHLSNAVEVCQDLLDRLNNN